MTRPKETSKLKSFLRNNLLTVLTIVGVVGGAACGILIKNNTGPWTKRDVMYVAYPGELFLNMLKGLIVPLLVSSITSAIASLDLSMSGRIAARAIVYYFTTTICAVILGIFLVCTIKPGYAASSTIEVSKKSYDEVLTSDTLMDLVRNLFPRNIVEAAVFTFKTKLTLPPNVTREDKLPITEYNIGDSFPRTPNVLGLVMFSVVLGLTIGKMREKGRVLADFFTTLSEAMMIITSWVIWISPVGVFFLVVSKLLEMESIVVVVTQLGWYFLTVMLGLFLHGFGTIAIIFFFCTRRLPYGYVAKMTQVLVTAFGTGSSSATMPITIGCLDNMGIDHRVTRFVIPVGATINMDGTALYEAVAALFIAQFRRADFTFGDIVAVSITATAASIGAAGIPQAGLVTMVMVLDTVGLPSEDVSIILAIDWLLDRFRTTINVMCDALGTILVNHLSKKDLGALSQPDKLNAEPHELLELGTTTLEDGKE